MLRGERPCEPCRYLDRVTGQAARAALEGRVACGRRSLSGGRLNVGDSIGVNRPVAPVPPHSAFTARSDD
ncbi:MAG: hypothetical protein ACR2JO_12935 [Mycobacteriales bacterium]